MNTCFKFIFLKTVENYLRIQICQNQPATDKINDMKRIRISFLDLQGISSMNTNTKSSILFVACFMTFSTSDTRRISRKKFSKLFIYLHMAMSFRDSVAHSYKFSCSFAKLSQHSDSSFFSQMEERKIF